MGSPRVAEGKKNAQRLNAHLVFIDESGLLLSPLVRRTWAPRGSTPVLYQRTRSYEKVSLIAALTLAPRRRRVGLYFSLRPAANVNSDWMLHFLRQLTYHIRGPIIVVWDRLNVHRAKKIASWVQRHPRLELVFLPPYAPELNPAEYLFGYTKRNPLANWAPPDADVLAEAAVHYLLQIKRRPTLLRSFLEAVPLSLCPKSDITYASLSSGSRYRVGNRLPGSGQLSGHASRLRILDVRRPRPSDLRLLDSGYRNRVAGQQRALDGLASDIQRTRKRAYARRILGSGLYFYRISTPEFTDTKKMLLLK